MTMKYGIKIEKTRNGFVPELPGCVAAADSLEATQALIEEAIAFHLEGLETQRRLNANEAHAH
jgi:predicted RNase H-like HicB family nuclease